MNVTSKVHIAARPEPLPAPRVEAETPRSRHEQLRPWLRHTAKSLRESPAQYTPATQSAWEHFTSGCWSPIDSFEHEGVLYVIAQRVPQELNGSKALTLRDQAVLNKIAEGVSNKCIAYEVGLSQATISMVKAQIHEKLNVRSNAELARLLWVLRSSARPQAAAVAGYWVIDRQEYVAFSGRAETANIAMLSRAERIVFEAVISGLATNEIASLRGATPRTIANQLASIFRKLQLGSRSELLARYAHCYRESRPAHDQNASTPTP